MLMMMMLMVDDEAKRAEGEEGKKKGRILELALYVALALLLKMPVHGGCRDER
jgi:hypothetical protein